MITKSLAVSFVIFVTSSNAVAIAQRERSAAALKQNYCYKPRNGGQTVCLPVATSVKAPAQLRVAIPKAGGCGGSSSCGNNNRDVAAGLEKRWVERRIEASPQFRLDSGPATFRSNKMMTSGK